MRNLNLDLKKILAAVGYHSKPDFLIIGAQKAGTTGLYNILVQHSRVEGPTRKELHYFDSDYWYSKNRMYRYHCHFPLPHNLDSGIKLFEATPLYLFHPESAKRLFNYNPKLKLIILLREPAARAFSAWTMCHHHFKKSGRNRPLLDMRSFSEAIDQELENINDTSYYSDKRSYVKRGIYHTQIEEYLKYFDRKQLLIIESNSLLFKFDQTLESTLEFIELPYEKLNLIMANKQQINEKVKYKSDIEKLRAFYKPYNEKLFELLGEEYDWND